MTPDMRWKQNTCPICHRQFRVTPLDDIFVPACGCYNDAPEGAFPCEDCGLAHYYAHENKPPPRKFVAITRDGEIIASAEGAAGQALIGEFFIDPEEGV